MAPSRSSSCGGGGRRVGRAWQSRAPARSCLAAALVALARLGPGAWEAFGLPPSGSRSDGDAAQEGSTRRSAALWPALAGPLLAATPGPSLAEVTVEVSGPTLRTLRPVPEIPVATSVILLRTTAEAVVDWGCYTGEGQWQAGLFKQRRAGFEAFKKRYETYDMSMFYNETLVRTKDPRTNRFYFSFLNECEWRTLSKAIKQKADRVRFSRVIGDRLYRKILSGDSVGPRVNDTMDGEYDTSSPFFGRWPKLEGGPPSGKSPTELRRGAEILMGYLREVRYCKGFMTSEWTTDKNGCLAFVSLLTEPANLEATTSLMRSNDDFAPRYDQRILQAYFADNFYESEFTDMLADDLNGNRNSALVQPQGIRTSWKLCPDEDAGL